MKSRQEILGAPFLISVNHNFISLNWGFRIPRSYRITRTDGLALLAKVLRSLVPRSITLNHLLIDIRSLKKSGQCLMKTLCMLGWNFTLGFFLSFLSLATFTRGI